MAAQGLMETFLGRIVYVYTANVTDKQVNLPEISHTHKR